MARHTNAVSFEHKTGGCVYAEWGNMVIVGFLKRFIVSLLLCTLAHTCNKLKATVQVNIL